MVEISVPNAMAFTFKQINQMRVQKEKKPTTTEYQTYLFLDGQNVLTQPHTVIWA